MSVDVITIYLGSKCNLNCAYCHREKDENEQGITNNLLELLDKEKPKEIHFFGGEPTLYMKDIEKVVDYTKNYTKYYTVTTNGVLLDKYIEYFKEHNFKIVVSFDGSEEDLRGFNPLHKVGNYPKVCVSTTLFHGNTDFKKIISKFCEFEKQNDRLFMFYPHIAHHTNDKNKQYSLTKEDVDIVLAEYKKAIEKFWRDFEQFGVINLRYRPIFAQLLMSLKNDYKIGETYCINKHCLKVNANGDKFNCLYVRNIHADKNKQYIKDKFPACVKCKYYHMCGGACVHSMSHDIECKFYYGLYDYFTKFIREVSKTKLNQLKELLK